MKRGGPRGYSCLMSSVPEQGGEECWNIPELAVVPGQWGRVLSV